MLERRQEKIMFSSNVYSYIDVLNKASDASWLREQTLANNLSNVNTPGYKRKDVDFQGVLRRELGNMKFETLDTKVENADLGTDLRRDESID